MHQWDQAQKLEGGDPDSWSWETWKRLEIFTAFCPIYKQTLLVYPDYIPWLEKEENLFENFGGHALKTEWASFNLPAGEKEPNSYLEALRKFRRKISLRVAYREIHGFSKTENSFKEMTLLAEMCTEICYNLALTRWRDRWGIPWNEETDREATGCVLAMGKLGADELNFCSDIDLIYFYEGNGYCRKGNRTTSRSIGEFYGKVAQTATSFLIKRTREGFLFNVDLRLRPHGEKSPIAPSFQAIENYYYQAGQTWERLAWMRARPVAGDKGLGQELLEALNPFRYPRSPSPLILQEISTLKARTEKEIVGSAQMDLHVKNGRGGIREIAFFLQGHQFLSAGKNPFLQSHNTLETLEKLELYGILDSSQVNFLRKAYLFLRAVENRLQMREERQTHLLPEDKEDQRAIALSMGYWNWESFAQEMNKIQDEAHAFYLQFYPPKESLEDFDLWWNFLTKNKLDEPLKPKLEHWFGTDPGMPAEVRKFALGSQFHQQVTRELVYLIVDLTCNLDAALESVFDPLQTLYRIGEFATKYGSRLGFFKACAENPVFFKGLCRLFDRSRFVFQLLCQHPEIFAEITEPDILKRKKSGDAILREMALLPAGEDFADWLWLYVKAEHVRFIVAELVDAYNFQDSEQALTRLADATVLAALHRVDPEGRLGVIALGKFGGAEMTLGSDLDFMILCDESEEPQVANRKIMRLQKILAHAKPLGRLYEIDLRLRPHGDAGPLAVKLSSLERYHRSEAKIWERQLMLRSRMVAGSEEMARDFAHLRSRILFGNPIALDDLQTILHLRERIEKERDPKADDKLKFKSGAGGIVDIEFLAQMTCLAHCPFDRGEPPANTRQTLRFLKNRKLLPAKDVERLMVHYEFLRRLERLLRRDTNRGVSLLSEHPREQDQVAFWLGLADRDEVFATLAEVRAEVRNIYRENARRLEIHLSNASA